MNTETLTDAQAMALTNKISESFREVTGMPSEVFLATVIGNIEQGYRERVPEIAAKYGWNPADLTGTFCESASKGMLEMALEHEAKALLG